MTLGNMAGEDATPRDDFLALVPPLIDDDADDDILIIIIKKKTLKDWRLRLTIKNLRKTTDEVGCLITLMNSLNEVISVHFCAKTVKRELTRKLTPK